MQEIMDAIRRFNEERDWDQFHSPANVAKSIAIEAGELLECFQWDEENYDEAHVKEEIADVMNYCFVLCDRLGADPKEIILDKLVKNAEKYPADRARGKNLKYDVLQMLEE